MNGIGLTSKGVSESSFLPQHGNSGRFTFSFLSKVLNFSYSSQNPFNLGLYPYRWTSQCARAVFSTKIPVLLVQRWWDNMRRGSFYNPTITDYLKSTWMFPRGVGGLWGAWGCARWCFPLCMHMYECRCVYISMYVYIYVHIYVCFAPLRQSTKVKYILSSSFSALVY